MAIITKNNKTLKIICIYQLSFLWFYENVNLSKPQIVLKFILRVKYVSFFYKFST